MSTFAFDRAPAGATSARAGYAIDRGTSRAFDAEGRLRVSSTPISKAAVNDYYGWEIPGAAGLRLDPTRTYSLLRDPAELAKAAPSFAGVQLLDEHIPVSADAPQTGNIVGAIGTDVRFDDPYLKASLIVWDAAAIRLIERDEKRQLSAGYAYDADMTPGVWRGQSYDGVMRNIRGNHVTLVPVGRAGPDVVVGDSAMLATDRGRSGLGDVADVRREAGRWVMRRAEAERETAGFGVALDGIVDPDTLYLRALRRMGIDTAELSLPACRAMFRHMRGHRGASRIAQDAATEAGFLSRFPNVARIRKA